MRCGGRGGDGEAEPGGRRGRKVVRMTYFYYFFSFL